MDRQLWKEYRNLLIRAAVFLLLLYLVFTRVLFLKQVEGVSMFPSLKDGDLALGFRLQREYRTGDVVAYEEDGTTYFGRVIAKESDEVIIDGNGEVTVNGVSESGEEVLYPTYDGGSLSYPYQVPEDALFLLGDYRTKAADSRSYGAVPRRQIKGKVITILRRRGL